MKWQIITCLTQCIGTIVSMMVAVFAFKTWRENRKSVNFELIQKLEETFDENVAESLKLYFERREYFKVDGVSIIPDSAEIGIKGILRWYSSLGMMFAFKIVEEKIIGRYKCQFSKVVEDDRIKEYFSALVRSRDARVMRPYYGFLQLIELWGSEDLKLQCKIGIAKEGRIR